MPSHLRLRRFSSLKLLSADQQAVPVFDADRQDTDFTTRRVDLVENAKAVVRADAKLPSPLRMRSAVSKASGFWFPR